MKRIVLTGGGTAGHVTPNLALAPSLVSNGFDVCYIGGRNSMEQNLASLAGLTYKPISSGKLRRYLDLKNFTDVFRTAKGVVDALITLRELKPAVVFSKGGFVAVPVVVAARMLKIKTIIHESDITPGLANKIAVPFADCVCVNFPETLQHLPKDKVASGKATLTGTPIRAELYAGDVKLARDICAFKDQKPVLLVMGGSQGAVRINDCLRGALPSVLKHYNVIHLCGKGNLADSEPRGYKQFEYVSSELPHLLAYADIVISRAGANSIAELLALRKPNLLIPLSRHASRGDQILNAQSFEKQGYSMVLSEEDLTVESLLRSVNVLYQKRKAFAEKMSLCQSADGTKKVLRIINELCEL
ncbi:MAG: undecaprenyldiphospho-muramoylpentapeptide beta-N-acetylglucosaminyltransferase [Clostridiales bacterium]|jgi:UDP-N-acetylglucosamine--N-acetylmuramyl-(pentapeptide) pyrophosphoryl-undecaprenol N-acetylglucosamine transferase|nr:undecaprenyldiphospho-muramoylpentapeptide beta-N-acetylglucosaminyltransferase [Clostridiales bacterium]